MKIRSVKFLRVLSNIRQRGKYLPRTADQNGYPIPGWSILYLPFPNHFLIHLILAPITVH